MNYWEELGKHWMYACSDIHWWEVRPQDTWTTQISVMPYLMELLK